MYTIFWNVDDVLNNLTEAWLSNHWSPSHPDCAVEYSDLHEFPPYRVLGATEKEYLDSVHLYRPVADKELEPKWIVLDWLWRYGRDHRHFAITSRPLSGIPSASDWVFRHYGDYIRGFATVPYRLDRSTIQYDRDKAGYLRWFGHKTVLIDDNLDAVGSARRCGIKSVLFPQPWNQSRYTQEQALAQLAEAVGQTQLVG